MKPALIILAGLAAGVTVGGIALATYYIAPALIRYAAWVVVVLLVAGGLA